MWHETNKKDSILTKKTKHAAQASMVVMTCHKFLLPAMHKQQLHALEAAYTCL